MSMNSPILPAFDPAAALKAVLGDWLRSMKAGRGLQFRTVTNAKVAAILAEIARKSGLPIIMTVSTTAYDKLGDEADRSVLQMTMTMLERMANRFNPIERGHWLATDPDVDGQPFHVVIQNNGGVICSVVTLPGEVSNPPADEGQGPTDMPDGQTRFRGPRWRTSEGRRQ